MPGSWSSSTACRRDDERLTRNEQAEACSFLDLTTKKRRSFTRTDAQIGDTIPGEADLEKEGIDMDPERRKLGMALACSILLNSPLGLQPLSLAQRGIKLHDEELLDICKTEIPIWWRLYFQGYHAEVRNVLSGHLLRLSTLAERSSRYQRQAANVASQAHQLAFILAIQQQDFCTALMHTQRAFHCGMIAEDFNLQTTALIREGYVYYLVNDPESMLYVYQKAFQHCEKMPPLIEAQTYTGLAKSHAFLKQEDEADHFMGLARDTFPEHPEEDPTYVCTNWDSFTRDNYEVIAYLQLNQPKNAWQVCEKIAKTETLRTTQRAELLVRQAETSFAFGKMDQCCSYVEQAVGAAWELDSDLRYNQAYNVYQLLLNRWPREKGVQDLAVWFSHQGR